MLKKLKYHLSSFSYEVQARFLVGLYTPTKKTSALIGELILGPLSRQHCAAIGCTENSQLKRETVHSDLRSDELLFYMQGMDCSELVKNTIFNEHPVCY